MVPADRRRSRKAAEGVSGPLRRARREEGSGWNHEAVEGTRWSEPSQGEERSLGRVGETVDSQPQGKRVDDEECRDESVKGTSFRWEPWLRDVPPGPADREVSDLPEGVGNGEVREGFPPGGSSGDEAHGLRPRVG
jgi:hypothetical protein